MQIVLSADSENQVHSSQLADGKLHLLMLFAAAVPYSLGRFGVYSSFSFELLYIQTSLFAMCSDARDTTPNAKCCWCRQQEGRSLRPVGRERGLSAFSHCFWKEQFHTIWRRFNVDSSFLIILIYIYIYIQRDFCNGVQMPEARPQMHGVVCADSEKSVDSAQLTNW